MGVLYNPRIVTNGLVMHVDAANVKSYPGSGTTWFDLSGVGNHLTLTGSPVFTSNVAQFNGSTQYADNTLNLSSGTSTIIGASRYSGAINGRVITAKTTNWLLGHWTSSVANYYAGGWVTPAVATGGFDTTWRIYAGTNDVTSDLYNFYINGSLNVSNNGGTVGPNGISVGRGFSGEPSACEVSFVMAYNRVLTADEIQQNFNALRGRFGI